MESWSSGVLNSLRRALDYSNAPGLQFVSFLLVPFQDNAVHHAADFQQLFLVVHHISSRESSDGVVFAQKNRLLGTDLLAHSAENAADHVDIVFLGILHLDLRASEQHVFEMLQGDGKAGDDCREVHSLAPVELWS